MINEYSEPVIPQFICKMSNFPIRRLHIFHQSSMQIYAILGISLVTFRNQALNNKIRGGGGGGG